MGRGGRVFVLEGFSLFDSLRFCLTLRSVLECGCDELPLSSVSSYA